MASVIPIRNIYYMLSYAYDVLNEGDNASLAREDFDNIYDLLGKILANGSKLLIKRGFNREYVCMSDELPVLRGKIDIGDSVRKQNFIRGKLSCEFDELSVNILFNQILKTSIEGLINYKKLDTRVKEELINISRYFQEIESVRLQKFHFSRLSYHRNNRFYRLLIDICELLYDETIVASQKGGTVFKDFIRDRRMATLYEKFILKFYKKELPCLRVYSPIIEWEKDAVFEHVGESFLPIMRTDIVLQSDKTQLIIDAKYYSNALQIRDVGDTKKLISSNLYQIYTYIGESTVASNLYRFTTFYFFTSF